MKSNSDLASAPLALYHHDLQAILVLGYGGVKESCFNDERDGSEEAAEKRVREVR